jgi:hypothetical protein
MSFTAPRIVLWAAAILLSSQTNASSRLAGERHASEMTVGSSQSAPAVTLRAFSQWSWAWSFQ